MKTFQIGALDQDKLFNLTKKGKEKTNKQTKQRAGFVSGGLKTLKKKVIQKSEVPERKAVRSSQLFQEMERRGGKKGETIIIIRK